MDSVSQEAAADDTLTGRAFEPDRPLPRGRHGLPREAVAEAQRRRIITSMVSAVADRGYAETRVVDVIERAGVSRATFYDLFDDLEDCFLATYEHVGDLMLETSRAAFDFDADAPWPERIRAAMAALLELLASWPEAARFVIVEVFAAGPAALDRRDRSLRRFVEIVDAGRAESPIDPPADTALAVMGGVRELLFREVIRGDTARLPRRLPEIVYWITLPYLGTEAAAAERDRARRSPTQSRR
jgi:AcrR family transcriptional regulator